MAPSLSVDAWCGQTWVSWARAARASRDGRGVEAAALSLVSASGPRRHLGEGLRALLAAEVRGARLTGRAACERAPAHLPPGCAATRCALRLASGATAAVVLGGPVAGAWPGRAAPRGPADSAAARAAGRRPCRGAAVPPRSGEAGGEAQQRCAERGRCPAEQRACRHGAVARLACRPCVSGARAARGGRGLGAAGAARTRARPGLPGANPIP